jgi:hypothetical protein
MMHHKTTVAINLKFVGKRKVSEKSKEIFKLKPQNEIRDCGQNLLIYKR